MSTTEEEIIDGIKSMLKMPDRDFSKDPLQQDEITALIETLVNEVNNPKLEESLAQFYLGVIDFLKTKIFYN